MIGTSTADIHKSSIAFESRPIHVKRFLSQTAASQHIASVLRTGTIPWKNEIINDRNSGLPLCVANRESFTPINTLLIQIASRRNNFVGRWWGTLSTWKRLGGIVDVSNEPASVFDETWTPIEVFCIDQVQGASVDPYRVRNCSVVPADKVDFSLIEKLVEVSGADIRIGVGDENHSALENWYVAPNPWAAFPFHAKGDYILLQSPQLFPNFRYSLLHEFTHWAEVRTNWIGDMHERELVAEIASGWLASEFGVPPCRCPVSHQRWLERWLWEMKRDETYIVRAAEQATKAMQFLLSILKEGKSC